MTLQTRHEARSAIPLQAKTETVFRCQLCGEKIALASDFRRTSVVCPHCGLTFAFDPQERPLPARGVRLRVSDVVELQRRGQQDRRHTVHVPAPAVTPPQPGKNWASRLGVLCLALAGIAAFFLFLRGRP